jgi:hypothetical protein
MRRTPRHPRVCGRGEVVRLATLLRARTHGPPAAYRGCRLWGIRPDGAPQGVSGAGAGTPEAVSATPGMLLEGLQVRRCRGTSTAGRPVVQKRVALAPCLLGEGFVLGCSGFNITYWSPFEPGPAWLRDGFVIDARAELIFWSCGVATLVQCPLHFVFSHLSGDRDGLHRAGQATTAFCSSQRKTKPRRRE